jgi:hypothetical protein
MEFKLEECPLIINGCRIAEIPCKVEIEQFDDELFVTEIEIDSSIVVGPESKLKDCVILKPCDREHSALFDALAREAVKLCSDDFYDVYYSCEEQHYLRAGVAL